MLIAGDPADRDTTQRRVGTEQVTGHPPEPAARRSYLGKGPDRYAEQVSQFGGPPADHDVVEERPGRVGRIGGEHSSGGATGQVPQHPRVDGAEGELAGGGEVAVGEHPLDLGRREIGIEHQAGALPDQREVAGVLELVTRRRGATVLPDDGAVEGGASGPVPGHHRLTLVGDPDRPRHPLLVGEASGHLDERGLDGVPDLAGVVLHPPGARVVLGQFAIGDVHHPGPVVDHQCPNPGGTGVDGDGDGGAGGHRGTVLRTAAGSGSGGRPDRRPAVWHRGTAGRRSVGASCGQSFAILREQPLNWEFSVT